MANNNFKVFAPNTSNIRDDSSYDVLNERLNGFQPNTVISSSTMNTVLRQTSLLTYAIAKVMVDKNLATKDISPNSTVSDVETDVTNFFNGIAKVTLGLNSLGGNNIPIWNGSRFVNNLPSGDAMVLAVDYGKSTPEWLSWESLVVGLADVATKANSLESFSNESSGTTVKFSFGPSNNKTTFEHTINVDIPGSVESASNVSSTIAGKLITAIFESDGITVKKATLATNATNLNGGSPGSLPYQGDAFTEYLAKPATSSPYYLQMTNSGIPSWVLNANMTVGNATNANNASNLTVAGIRIGAIPFKNIYENFSWINPPASTNTSEEYVLITNYNSAESGGQEPKWTGYQRITVVENSDGTVDVTINNV